MRFAGGLAVRVEDRRYAVVDVATGLALTTYGSRRCAFALVAMLAPSWQTVGEDVRRTGGARHPERIALIVQAFIALVRRSDVGEDDGCDPDTPMPYDLEDRPKDLQIVQKYYGYGDGCSEGMTVVLERDERGAKKRWAHKIRRPWGGDAEWLLFGPNYHPKRAAGEEYGEIKALCTFKSLKGLLRKELA
jgi:hypothetical protein